MKTLNDVVEYIGVSSVSGCEAQSNTMNNTFQAYIRGLTNHDEVDGGMGPRCCRISRRSMIGTSSSAFKATISEQSGPSNLWMVDFQGRKLTSKPQRAEVRNKNNLAVPLFPRRFVSNFGDGLSKTHHFSDWDGGLNHVFYSQRFPINSPT